MPSSTQKKPQSTIKKSFLLQNRGSHRLTTSFSLQLAEEALFFLSRDVKTELHVQTDGLNDERSALVLPCVCGLSRGVIDVTAIENFCLIGGSFGFF